MHKDLYRVGHILALMLVLLMVTGTVLAADGGPASPPQAGGAPQGEPPVVTLPEHAVQVAPGVFYLGKALDKGRVVEGYAFVRYKKGFGKPNKPGKPPSASSCYEFLARGAKWKNLESYLANPSNKSGLEEDFVVGNIAADIAKWEDAADGTVEDGDSVDILGSGSSTGETLVADTVAPDGENEVYFANIADANAIAVTIIWGIFGGPPQWRELVEWDQVYEDVDFAWADCTAEGADCTSKMDFENIATHELGHAVGLGDLYTTGCSEQTMYGYADYGETKKRTLEAGDIKGVSELYK